MTTRRQLTRCQDWALHELAAGERPSARTHTRTLRSLERARLVRFDDGAWWLTKAGEREALRATKRMERRSA